ncbi:pyridoxamine 5'-phosphate oxidase family protein [Croceicoccus gelatinilyticus]|uniref:pyridoxamine 5'-phosphate oxidase family protein n=1 Tax=Croceicoccus gelatinilyticus TaxID=2835536 RepID=UPI001BCC3D54|nr:pyridoxamine 5'-phosphate oxidase family protein [Croceicoccus gelatinilyticus]MBS7670653.1 pyridoxamine 5'-phosphate oxidase family protein [Croceicoccus gelatinilyticus]
MAPPEHANEDIFHEGELAMQRAAGVADRMAIVGPKVIRTFMPDQHRQFYEQLPFLVAASVDEGGDVWATLMTGEPGFISSPSPTDLSVRATLHESDPALDGLREGGAIGLLGIELHTRRRNRVNGLIDKFGPNQMQIRVRHAFGNCPKHVRLRQYAFHRNPSLASAESAVRTTSLDAAAVAIIENADTFFVASYADTGGERLVDVSHRGGLPGFVKVETDGTLTVPDFAGNLYFNTLGNFVVNPRAGLLFVDFAIGDLLQLTGKARIIHSGPQVEQFEGAQRLWNFAPDRIVLRPAASPLRWTTVADGISPHSRKTGTWSDVAQGAPGQIIDGSEQERGTGRR